MIEHTSDVFPSVKNVFVCLFVVILVTVISYSLILNVGFNPGTNSV